MAYKLCVVKLNSAIGYEIQMFLINQFNKK